jgi:hypothetical protein
MNQKRTKTQKLAYLFTSITQTCMGLAEHPDFDSKHQCSTICFILQATITSLFQTTSPSKCQNSRCLHGPLRVLSCDSALQQKWVHTWCRITSKSVLGCRRAQSSIGCRNWYLSLTSFSTQNLRLRRQFFLGGFSSYFINHLWAHLYRSASKEYRY